MSTLNRTFFNEKHREHGATMVPFWHTDRKGLFSSLTIALTLLDADIADGDQLEKISG
jgi:hypothetical protein